MFISKPHSSLSTSPIFSVQFHKYSGLTGKAGLENSMSFPVSKIISVTRRARMVKPFLDIAIPFKKGKEGHEKRKKKRKKRLYCYTDYV